MKLILASKSQIRSKILSDAGLVFQVETKDIDERAEQQKLAASEPTEIAKKLAELKALEVSRYHPTAIVIGADQLLSFKNKILHKSTNFEDAFQKLKTLSGHTHELTSGLAVVKNGNVLFSTVSQAKLTMHSHSDTEIKSYLERAGASVFASVGCYQLESIGINLFSDIQGDYYTILGLPLLPLLNFLKTHQAQIQ